MKNFLFYIITCIAFSAVLFQCTETKAEGKTISEIRYKKIYDLIQTYKNNGSDLSKQETRTQILKDLSKDMPIAPSGKPDARPFSEISKEARVAVNKQYSQTREELVKAAQEEADKKYVLKKINDKVNVHYQLGNKPYETSGRFLAYGGNSVKIESQYIAIYDLDPESRAMFDQNFNEQERKKFIEEKVRAYNTEKSDLLNSLRKDMMKKQFADNEKAGYILHAREWLSAKQIFEKLIQKAAEEQQKENADKAAAEPVKTVEKTELPAPTAPQLKLDDLKKKLADRISNIANTCSGIDADQGYNQLALWGMSKEDVTTLLADKAAANAKTDDDKFTQKISTDSISLLYPNGAVSSVEMFFIQNMLYKVTVHFRITSTVAIQKLSNILHDRYGFTDEEIKAKETSTPPPQEDKKQDQSKSKAKAASAIQTESYHWTGKVTHGTIIIELNKDKNVYQSMTLIKESPAVKDDAASILRKAEEERKEALRQKEIDALQGKKIEF